MQKDNDRENPTEIPNTPNREKTYPEKDPLEPGKDNPKNPEADE